MWGAEHGRLKDGSRYKPWPFQVEILDTMVAPRTTMFTWMKSARVGYTQSLLVYIAHRIVNDPGNGLMVRPDKDVAAAFSKEHINEVLNWPVVKQQAFARQLAGTNRDTITEKYFPGGWLKSIGANSPTGFRDHDADFVIFDEVDGYPVVAGVDGDQLALGHKRLEQSHDPRDIAGSTPTDEAISKINRRFLLSDMRRYHVPCPHCGETQTLVWGHGRDDEPGLRWKPFKAPEEIWYQCKNGCRFEENRKLWALQNGLWIPEKPEVYEQTGHAGFHVNSLYSLQPGADWKDLIEEFLGAYRTPATHKTFVNTTLGLVWAVQGEAPEWKRLYDRREDRQKGVVPYGGCFLTCGVDVQAAGDGRVEAYVWAWGRGGTCWLVEHKVIYGSAFEQRVWDELYDFVRGKWQHENGSMLGLEKVAVDMGYATQMAYRFCRKLGVSFALPVKGAKELSALPIAPSKAMEQASGKGSSKNKVHVHNVGGHALKQELYAALNLDMPEDGKPWPLGFVHLPSFVDDEVCKQLVAEQWVAEKNDWIKKHANEALDCWCYARAAAIWRGADKWTDAEWAILEAQFAHPDSEASRPPEEPLPVRQAAVERPEPSRPEPEAPRMLAWRDSDWFGGGGDDWLGR